MTVGKGKFANDAGMLITTALRQCFRAAYSRYVEQRRWSSDYRQWTA